MEPETRGPRDWWLEMMKLEHFDNKQDFSKLVLLGKILKESEKFGDKVIVFLQSPDAFPLIEKVLSRINEATKQNFESENIKNRTESWSLGLDYFQLDDQTSLGSLLNWCENFNEPSNIRARLFLILTRAANFQINFAAANRVIIFDASWDPSHDVQNIFAMHRFGQRKTNFIYRFLSKDKIDEKIYERQVEELHLNFLGGWLQSDFYPENEDIADNNLEHDSVSENQQTISSDEILQDLTQNNSSDVCIIDENQQAVQENDQNESFLQKVDHMKADDSKCKSPYKCSKCKKCFESSEFLANHMINKSCDKTCPIRDKIFTAKCSVLLHNVLSHLVIKLYKCSVCSQEFRSEDVLSKHMRHHSEIKLFTCDVCSKQFKTKGDISTHMRIHLNIESYKCSVCSKEFQSEDMLSEHMRHHSEIKLFTCDVCSKQFKRKGHISSHMLIHLNIKPYKCRVCSKEFRHTKDLKVHERIHSGIIPYKCSVCSKQFRHKGNLTVHERIHSGIIPYKCSVCLKKFRHLGSLTVHKRIHSGIIPYKCSVCSKQFRHKGHLTVHERIHSGIKPYKCSLCGNEFREKGNLMRHERIHSRIKSYKCSVCSKEFQMKGNLTVHERIHSGIKSYKCSVCPTEFQMKGNLTVHERIHSGIKLYKCSLCAKKYTRKQNLLLHERQIHPSIKLIQCEVCKKEFKYHISLKHHIKNHH